MAIGDPDGEAALAEIRDAARNKLGQNTSAYNELSQLSRNLGSGSEKQEGQVTHESHKIHTEVRIQPAANSPATHCAPYEIQRTVDDVNAALPSQVVERTAVWAVTETLRLIPRTSSVDSELLHALL